MEGVYNRPAARSICGAASAAIGLPKHWTQETLKSKREVIESIEKIAFKRTETKPGRIALGHLWPGARLVK
jgi:hypothetical protein